MTDTPSDRDALAEFIAALIDSETVDEMKALVAVHDRDLLGQAHAPIRAALDRLEDRLVIALEDGTAGDEQMTLDEVIAIGDRLDLAAVADHERDVQQRTLRDALPLSIPEDVLRAALDSMLDNGNARLRAGGSGNRIYPPALEDDLTDALRAAFKVIRARADALGGDDR